MANGGSTVGRTDIHDSMFEDSYLAVAGTVDLYYKTLRIHNLRKMDRFRIKQGVRVN